jgi:hypothetical protein
MLFNTLRVERRCLRLDPRGKPLQAFVHKQMTLWGRFRIQNAKCLKYLEKTLMFLIPLG